MRAGPSGSAGSRARPANRLRRCRRQEADTAEGPTSSRHRLIAEPDTQFDAPRGRPTAVASPSNGIGSAPRRKSSIVDVATQAVRVVAVRPQAARSSRRRGAPMARRSSPPSRSRTRPFNLYEFAVDGSAHAPADPYHAAAPLAGRLARWHDDRLRRLHRRWLRRLLDAVSRPEPAHRDTGAPRCSTWQAASEATAAQPSAVWRRPLTRRSHAGTDIVDASHRSQRRSVADRRRRRRLRRARISRLCRHRDVAPLEPRRRADTGTRSTRLAALLPLRSMACPRFFVSASAQTSFFAGPATDAGTPSAATLLARELEAGILLPMQQVRVLTPGARLRDSLSQRVHESRDQLLRTRRAARAAWQTSSAHTYGYSIQPRRWRQRRSHGGIRPPQLWIFADATVLTGDVRADLPAFAPHHVAAVRVAAGISTGDATAGRTFLLGGPDPTRSSPISDVTPSACCGASRPTPSPAATSPSPTPTTAGRLPAAARPRHLAAVSPHGSRGGVRRRRACVDARFQPAHQVLRPAPSFPRIWSPVTRSVHRTIGAAWGHDGSGLSATARRCISALLRRSTLPGPAAES